MTINRYLLYFSYIGKPFLGAQRQLTGRLPRLDDPNTVQGRLETALKTLNPCNEPIINLSSRTDSGVHALSTTAHVDLERANDLVYEPQTVTMALNRNFRRQDVPIRVIKTYLVPQDFHCRYNAISRTYLYRFAVIETDDERLAPHLCHIPIEEAEKCFFVCAKSFDINAMREASKLFVGLHDFRTFMHKSPHKFDKITRRIVNRCEIVDSRPGTYSTFSFPDEFQPEKYKFYEIYVEGDGFLYRQVRRMVATLLAIANAKLTHHSLRSMLQVPSHLSWNARVHTVPAHALYLCSVSYPPGDRHLFRRTC